MKSILAGIEPSLYLRLAESSIDNCATGKVLLYVQRRITINPLGSWGPRRDIDLQKELDRQPIGATLNLPQEAP